MPAITMEMTKLTKEQRAELVKDFTESAARVTGIPKMPFMSSSKKMRRIM